LGVQRAGDGHEAAAAVAGRGGKIGQPDRFGRKKRATKT
jgi:hypothetical protein